MLCGNTYYVDAQYTFSLTIAKVPTPYAYP